MRVEAPIQRAIVAYLRAVLPAGAVVHHCANEGVRGGQRGRLDQAIRKGLGTVAGFPDLVLALPGRVAFLEVKGPAGRVSPSQRDMHAALAALGHPIAVVRSVEDTRAALAEWGVETREKETA